jgi:hypothetical protein
VVIEVIIGFSSLVWSYEEVLTQYGGYLINSLSEQFSGGLSYWIQFLVVESE